MMRHRQIMIHTNDGKDETKVDKKTDKNAVVTDGTVQYVHGESKILGVRVAVIMAICV